MSLSNYKINQQLERYIDQFLNPASPPHFSLLKRLLISRQPIEPIHTQIVSELTEMKNRAQSESRSRLEREAIQQQMREDSAEKARDDLESKTDQQQRTRLEQERLVVATQREGFVLQQNSSILAAIMSGSNMNQHAHPSSARSSSVVHTHAGSTTVHTHADAQRRGRLRRDRLLLESAITTCDQRIISINHALSALQNKQASRALRTSLRGARQSAQLLSFGNIEDNLTPQLFAQLMSNIQNENHALEALCVSLIHTAMDTNYPAFLRKMDSFLSSERMSDIESNSLRAIVRLMHQCSEYDREAQAIHAELTALMATIHRNQEEIRRNKGQLDSLRQVNPTCQRHNERLVEENSKLELARINDTQKRDKLFTPSLILLASTFVASTPLILTLTGVIPAILTPALLFTLVSFPAAFLAVATIIVGTMAITYAIKTRIHASTIQSNQKTIDENTKKMQGNRLSIAYLEDTAIPVLLQQIDANECSRQELNGQLERTKALSAQLLEQASRLEPIRVSQSPSSLFGSAPSAPPAFEVLLPPPYSEEGAPAARM